MESDLPDNVINWIQEWAERDIDRIKKAYQLNGGWEKWAQVEIAFYINDNTGSNAEVIREMPIYENKKAKVDLLVNGLAEEEFCPVELKTVNLFHDLSELPRLAEDILEDLEKSSERKENYGK